MSDAEQSERSHYEEITNTFRYYPHSAKRLLARKRAEFQQLSARHQALLEPHYSAHLAGLERAMHVNAAFLRVVVTPDQQQPLFENQSELRSARDVPVREASEFNLEKLRSTLRLFVRDWSDEGKAERDQTYAPLIAELLRLKPPADSQRLLKVATRGWRRAITMAPQVLVPGAGLSRLAFDIARLGYSCTGNEFSFFMLHASNWVLNRCQRKYEQTLHPFVHQASNVHHGDDALRAVAVPDVCPGEFSDVLMRNDFAMAAGDFLEIFGAPDQKEQWDAVVTCFFIDTAHNVLEYMDTILHALRPGGVWINLGPLLFHYDGNPHERSIELPMDQITRLVRDVGFQFLAEPKARRVTYSANERSMLQSVYECYFFSAQKPARPMK